MCIAWKAVLNMYMCHQKLKALSTLMQGPPCRAAVCTVHEWMVKRCSLPLWKPWHSNCTIPFAGFQRRQPGGLYRHRQSRPDQVLSPECHNLHCEADHLL